MDKAPGKWKDEVRRQWKAGEKVKAKAALDELRRELRKLGHRRKEARTRLVALGRRNRRRLQAQITARRAAERKKLNALFAEWRARLAVEYRRRKEAIRRASANTEKTKRAILEEEARYRRLLIYGRKKHEAHQARASRAERREEADEAVLRNLEPELHGVWHKVKHHIQGSARRSRTEAFLEWLEANPDDAAVLGETDEERELRRMIREHEKEEQAAYKEEEQRRRVASPKGSPRKAVQSRRTLSPEELAAIPF